MLEHMNARYLTPEEIGEKADIITVDVSFISLKKIIPAVVPLLAPEGPARDARQAAIRGGQIPGRQGRDREGRGANKGRHRRHKAVRRAARPAGRAVSWKRRGRGRERTGSTSFYGNGEAAAPGPIFCEHYLRRFGYTFGSGGGAGAAASAPSRRGPDFMPFSQSDYYRPEMGEGLRRYFLLFEPLLERDRSRRHQARRRTGSSRPRARKGRRAVNMDPGYIALEQIVLGTTKGFSHRIYLGTGHFCGPYPASMRTGAIAACRGPIRTTGAEQLISLLNGWRERYKRTLRCQKA